MVCISIKNSEIFIKSHSSTYFESIGVKIFTRSQNIDVLNQLHPEWEMGN